MLEYALLLSTAIDGESTLLEIGMEKVGPKGPFGSSEHRCAAIIFTPYLIFSPRPAEDTLSQNQKILLYCPHWTICRRMAVLTSAGYGPIGTTPRYGPLPWLPRHQL